MVIRNQNFNQIQINIVYNASASINHLRDDLILKKNINHFYAFYNNFTKHKRRKQKSCKIKFDDSM